ncbi:MAG: NAD(+) synthase [Bacillota bacterium]|jgi:NAD+ synthase
MREAAEEIIQWLKDQLEKTGMNGFVLGLSGGVDSSVAAGLLMRACPEHALGVIMPAGNQEQDRLHGIDAAEAFAMPYIEIPLETHRQGLCDEVGAALREKGIGVRDERMMKGNIGARLRMTTLYAVGNSLNYLVVGTDNAAEFYTGYFTKYGDGGVDLLPLAHLTKGEVFRLGAYLGVPEQILQKPPSAGFFAGQTDESEMGVTYAVIDAFLRGEEIPERDREILERLHRVSEHKRHLPPSLRKTEE